MSPDGSPRRHAVGVVLRWSTALIAVGFIGLLAYGVIARSPDTTIDDSLSDDRAIPAPDFVLQILQRGDAKGPVARVVERGAQDGRLALRELRGSPVVLNFWASWCEPCRDEAEVLERGSRLASSQGVVFLGLNLQDAPEDAREFLASFDVSYPNVRDPDNGTLRRYGATGLPETFFISATGDIVAHVLGVITAAQLAEGVVAAQEGRVTPLGAGGDARPSR